MMYVTWWWNNDLYTENLSSQKSSSTSKQRKVFGSLLLKLNILECPFLILTLLILNPFWIKSIERVKKLFYCLPCDHHLCPSMSELVHAYFSRHKISTACCLREFQILRLFFCAAQKHQAEECCKYLRFKITP